MALLRSCFQNNARDYGCRSVTATSRKTREHAVFPSILVECLVTATEYEVMSLALRVEGALVDSYEGIVRQ